MDLLKAIEYIEKSKETKEKVKGMTLCSALSFLDNETELAPKKWEVNYFDAKTKLLTQVSVDSSGHVSAHASAKPFNENLQVCEVNPGHLKITAEEAVKTAKEHEKKTFSQPVQKIFVSVQSEGKKPVWSVNMITKILSIVTIKIDAQTGKVIDAQSKSVLKGK